MAGRQAPESASMFRRMGSGPVGRNRIAAGLAAVALAAALLVPAAPAEAGGWLGRGVGVAGAARSLKRNLGEAVDLLEETLGAAVQLDHEEVERLSGELGKFPGRIITDASLVLSIGAGALEKAKAAREGLKGVRQRVGRFVGEAVTDARMALETGKYELEAGVLDPKRPLPAVALSGPSGTRRPAPSGSSAASAPDPWGQDPEEDEKTATAGADPWGQDPEDEEPVAEAVDPPGEDGQPGREGGDVATERLQGEYAAALDRFLAAEEGSSDYEATLSALLEREKDLLAGVAGQEEEQELTPDERRRVQACLAEREFDPGAADGVFGPRTRTAVRAWQASQGREESGHLDRSSARTLLEECEVAVAEAETETTTASVERTFEPKCADIFNGKPNRARDKLMEEIEICHMEFSNRPGCHLALTKGGIYNIGTVAYFMDVFSTNIKYWIDSDGHWNDRKGEIYETHWSGECSDGVPDGEGTLAVFSENGSEKVSWTGRFKFGIANGDWTHHFETRWKNAWNSGLYRYSMMNGLLHGEYFVSLKGSAQGDDWCTNYIFEFVNGESVDEMKRTPC